MDEKNSDANPVTPIPTHQASATPEPESSQAHGNERSDLGALDLYFSLCLLLAGIVLAVFMQTRHFQFAWDDTVNVVRNPHFIPLTGESFARFWSEPYLSLYVPLTYNFLALEASYAPSPDPSSGLPFDPAVFHTGNLVLHVLCVLLVFTLLRLLVRHNGAAFLGALLFGLHPLQVESVSWITETKGLLAGVFSLFAIWQYLLYASSPSDKTTAENTANKEFSEESSSGTANRDAPESSREGSTADDPLPPPPISWSGVHLALSFVSLCLALLSKPSAVMVPAIALILEWGFLARPTGRSLAGIFLLVIPAAAMAIVTRNVQSPNDLEYVAPLWFRPFIVGDSLAFYIYKLVFPLWLGPDYGRAPETIQRHWWPYFAWIIPLAVGAGLCLLPHRRVWLAAAGVFVAGLLPVLGFVPFAFQFTSTVADRYVYLSMFGPAVALAWLLARYWQPPLIMAGGLVLLILGVASFFQAQIWRDQGTLFTYALYINPGSLQAHRNLSQIYAARGELDKSFKHLEEELKTRPRSWEAHSDYALAYVKMKRYRDAISHARQSIEIHPDNPQIHAILGLALANQANFAEAIKEYEEAIRLSDRPFLRALDGLGEVYVRQGKYVEGIKYFGDALKLRPDDPATNLHMATALEKVGDYKRAIEFYRRAMEGSGDAMIGSIELAWLLATSPDDNIRNGEQALSLIEKAREKTKSEDPLVFDAMAATYAELGRWQEAIDAANKALAAASETKDIELQYRIRQRLDLYKNKKPHRDRKADPKRGTAPTESPKSPEASKTPEPKARPIEPLQQEGKSKEENLPITPSKPKAESTESLPFPSPK
ncbi:MAG: tetratricopeptide repeat protein [Planctomycetota bacterium]